MLAPDEFENSTFLIGASLVPPGIAEATSCPDGDSAYRPEGLGNPAETLASRAKRPGPQRGFCETITETIAPTTRKAVATDEDGFCLVVDMRCRRAMGSDEGMGQDPVGDA